MEKLKMILNMHEWIPFILATGQQIHLSLARIIEALVIAAVVSGVTIYGMTMVIEAKLDSFFNMYARDYQVTQTWRNHVQDEIDETQEYLYKHTHKDEK